MRDWVSSILNTMVVGQGCLNRVDRKGKLSSTNRPNDAQGIQRRWKTDHLKINGRNPNFKIPRTLLHDPEKYMWGGEIV
jgi:hypothetical protein